MNQKCIEGKSHLADAWRKGEKGQCDIVYIPRFLKIFFKSLITCNARCNMIIVSGQKKIGIKACSALIRGGLDPGVLEIAIELQFFWSF